jgi:hypothetical protein
MFTLLRILTLGVVDLRRNKTSEERSTLLGGRRRNRRDGKTNDDESSSERLFDSKSTTAEGVLLRVFTAILVAAIATVWIFLAVDIGDSVVASGGIVDGGGSSETAMIGRMESTEKRVFEAFGIENEDDGRQVRAGAAWGTGWMQYH